MVYARFAMAGWSFVPECRWLRWTGIPCPGCGATRCLSACGRLDLAGAFQWHPLVATLAIAFLAWPVFLVIGRTWHLRWPLGVVQRIQKSITGRSFTAAVIANWLYLCWALPR